MPATYDLGRLRGRKLVVGTPMYTGQCCSDYAFAIAQLAALCTQLGIGLRYRFLAHEALITKARNIIVDEFLRGDEDALAFIDADIGFDARDVLHLLAMQMLDEARDAYDVIAAPYPLKQIAWSNVLAAAKSGVADRDAEALARYASPVMVHPVGGTTFPADAPVEVEKAGTGFMMIRRATFERFRARYPERCYGPGAVGSSEGGGMTIHAFFETEIDTKHGHVAEEIRAFLGSRPNATGADVLAFLNGDASMHAYGGKHVSEDYAFCQRVRAAGMKVWLCPWMQLTHSGSFTFASRLTDLSAIGVA